MGVSEQFSEYISGVTLCSQRVFQDALNGPNKDIFASIVNSRIPLPRKSVESLVEVLRESVGSAAGASHPLHAYCNKALALRGTLETKMKAMSTIEFEQVLHPIFQEDELTLILAGGVLGAAAGAIQMVLNAPSDENKTSIPMKERISNLKSKFLNLTVSLLNRIRRRD